MRRNRPGHRESRILALSAILAVLSVFADQRGAAQGPAALAATETRHLKLAVTAGGRTARPGDRVLLFVDVSPKPKMHVYAPEEKDYIPIQLTLAPGEHFRVLPAKYPRAEKFFFEPLQETQRVYSKPFRIVQPIVVSASAPEGPLAIKGTVRYQACDDTICYLPQELGVSWILSVGRAGR